MLGSNNRYNIQTTRSAAWFQILDVLDEKNTRQWTNAVALKGGVFFYFVSAWVSRNTELTINFKKLYFVSYLFTDDEVVLFWSEFAIKLTIIKFNKIKSQFNWAACTQLNLTHNLTI